MPHFATDADLLAYEPRVFIDVPLAGQQTLRVSDGELTANVLTSAAGGFAALAEQQVVTLSTGPADAVSMPIVSISDDHTLALGGTAPLFDGATGLTAIARTFAPQRDAVHGELLDAIGINPNDPALPLTEAAVVSVELMRRIEVLGTLWRAFAAGAGVSGRRDALIDAAEQYRRRYAAALAGARVLIDTDADGRADAWRIPAVARLVRG